MPKFVVPSELSPGVHRAGVGFYEVGDVLTLPDAATVPGEFIHPKLVPLDEEAVAMLMDGDTRRRALRTQENAERKDQGLPILPPWPKYKPAPIPDWAKAGEAAPPKPKPVEAAQTLAQLSREVSAPDKAVAAVVADAPFAKGHGKGGSSRAADR